MVRSGVRVKYPDIEGTPVDKHSTGGVGDKTSLILAPLAAACGAHVPMMSGRGLGHTGGTLDKLEAIPGFRTGLSLDQLRRGLATVGCALIGQTSEIAPADKKLYALRDVTATVESIPLICASIMSKKIAEGIGGLVLDVKTGDGAFMKTPEDSRALAESLVGIGVASGLRTEALITAMDAPLGRMVGNSLEVIESIDTLKGHGPADLEALSVLLAARMLVVAGIEPDEARAEHRVSDALRSGAGVEKLRQIIEFQGGDPGVVDDYARLPSTPDRHDVAALRAGYVSALRAGPVGHAAVALGAGRATLDDAIDPGVGIEVIAPVGTAVRKGEPVLRLYHRRGRGLDDAIRLLEQAVAVADASPPPRPTVVDRVYHRPGGN
jgi:pyrimidine-nucleoside phosphorylase